MDAIKGWALVVVSVCVGLLCAPVAMADDATPSTLDWQDVLVMLLNQVLPIVASFFSAYVTKGMLWLMSAAGARWSPALSSVVGAMVSGVSAAMLGQSPDMVSASAAVGGPVGLASHALLQSKPLATEPKPEPAS
mgnify:CR=1 FL=1